MIGGITYGAAVDGEPGAAAHTFIHLTVDSVHAEGMLGKQ